MRRRCYPCFEVLCPNEPVIHMWGSYWLCRDHALSVGGHVGRRQVALHDLDGDFSPANLKRLADAGIMDANALFLPDGKLSKAEADARERANILWSQL